LFATLILSLLQGVSSGETDFYFCQFLSNFFKYLSSNLLLFHPNKILTIYFSSNLLLLNFPIFGFNFTFHTFSSPSCCLNFTLTLSSNLSSFTNSFTFSKFSSFSYISFSVINLFQHTKYSITP